MRFSPRIAVKQLLLTFLLSLVASSLIEIIYRGSFQGFTEWLSLYLPNAIYLFLFLSLFYGSFYLLNNKGFFLTSVIFTAIFCLLAFSSHTKEVLRGDPLIPKDLEMGKEAKNMLQFFSDISVVKLIFIFLAGLALVIGIVYLYKRIKNEEANINNFIYPIISLLLFIGFISQDVFAQEGVLKKLFNIEVDVYNQKENYLQNGVMLSFLRNLKEPSGDELDNYSEKSIESIIENIKYAQPNSNADENPNIVFIQSEAFWDPTIMESISINKDPLPTFHQLSENFTSGYISVPVYGGNTSNTEFEVLTGMSNHFLPAGSIPYKHNINDALPALPNILRNQGYESVALHTYNNWFYERDTVYKWLGFDNFISLEFFPKPVQDMMYYRDQEITDEIIKRIKNADNPNFIFAVTMQNHGPYPADRKKFYASTNVTKTDGNLSKDAENILEFYTDNLVEIDKELARLVKELEKLDEKTIVVFFGDHLPLLGENYQVYQEAGYFSSDQSYEEYTKMYRTPFLIWNNYGVAKDEELVMNSSFLGPYVLNMAGLKGYYFTDYLNSLLQQKKSYLPRLDYVEKSTLTSEDIENYQQLQYDIIFGEQYGLTNQKVKYSPSKTYRLGYGDPNISDTKFTTYKGKKVIQLNGEYFTTSCQVYINGDPVESAFISSKKMYVFIPSGVTVEELQMKIFDSENTLLSASNIKKF